jgi:hypothetical protein
MKKGLIFLLTLQFILMHVQLFGQVPGNLSFQAVIRNSSNVLVVSSSVGVRISLLQGSSTGSAVYVETHTPTTNPNGLITLEIGGGKAVSGDFKNINWGLGNYFIKVETDPAGGTNYSITSTTQVLSVPYALYAKKSADVDSLTNKLKALDSALSSSNYGGKTTIVLSNDITDEEAKVKIDKEWGPYTEKIVVSRCTNLKKLDLTKLTKIISLVVYANDNLSEIDLSNVVSIESAFRVYDCPNLITIKSSNLESIKLGDGDDDGFEIYNNPRLKLLSFAKLKILDGGFSLERNDSLQTLDFSGLIGSKYTYMYFSGNKLLRNILFSSLQTTSSIDFSGTGLDSLVLPKYKYGSTEGGISISGNESLKSISIPELDSIRYIQISGNSALRNFNVPKLIRGNIYIESTSLDSISLPKYKTKNSNDNLYFVRISNLKTINIPELDSIGNLNINNNANLKSINMGKFVKANDIGIYTNDSLQSISIPAFKEAKNGFNIYSNALLTSLQLDNFSSIGGNTMILNNNLFSSTTINSFLSRFVNVFPQTSATITSKTFQLRQRVKAPPTGQGLVDRQTLTARGYTVNTD